jgi:hypothetical protein
MAGLSTRSRSRPSATASNGVYPRARPQTYCAAMNLVHEFVALLFHDDDPSRDRVVYVTFLVPGPSVRLQILTSFGGADAFDE